MVPKPFSFEHAKYDHAGAAFAIIVLEHLISADELWVTLAHFLFR
jgi:hypothetical protein